MAQPHRNLDLIGLIIYLHIHLFTFFLIWLATKTNYILSWLNTNTAISFGKPNMYRFPLLTNSVSRNSRSNPRWACVLFGLISCWKLSKTSHYNSLAFLSSGDLQVNSLVAPGLWSASWLLFFWICILKLRLFHILC